MSRSFRLFLVFAALALVSRAPVLGVPIVDKDEASYVVAAWEVLRGHALYRDVADHKPPLVYGYYLFCQLLGRGMLSVRLVTDLLTLPLTALALSAVYRHARTGAVAGILYLVAGASFVGHDMLAVNCEVILLLPACAAVALVGDAERGLSLRRIAAAGALLGVAALVKHQAAVWLPALGLAVVEAWRARAPDRPAPSLAPRLVLLGTTFALPIGLAAAWFAAQDRFDDFVYWNLWHNLRYAADPIGAREALTRAALTLPAFALATAPVATAAWLSWREHSGFQRRVFLALLVLSAVAVLPGFRFYPHYLILLYPPLALLAAPRFAAWLRWPLPAGCPRVVVSALVLVFVGFTEANTVTYLRDDLEEETLPVYAHVGRRLRRDPCRPGARLFVWGYAPEFYYFADLPLGARFLFPEEARIDPRHWGSLMQDLTATSPTFILDTAPAKLHHWDRYPLAREPRLASFVAAHYDFEGAIEDVNLYRRKGCDGEGLPVAAAPPDEGAETPPPYRPSVPMR